MKIRAARAALALAVAAAACGVTTDSRAANSVEQPSAAQTEPAAAGAVTTTPSGLQYEVLREGSGPPPSPQDSVTIAFRGFLLDGREFDSSQRRRTTLTFPLHRVIPGWTEGIQLMNEGAKYRFTIPANLAYGSGGAPSMVPPVPPDASVVFEIELLAIARIGAEPAMAPTAAQSRAIPGP